ncbi:MAG: ABC transporter permease [Bacteroidales bacterium]
MRILFTLLRKEFRQIIRNRMMLPVIFVIPVIQMVVLVYAASLEMKNVDMVVVDNSQSDASAKLVAHFTGSPFITVKGFFSTYDEAEKTVIRNESDVILRFNKNFETRLYNEGETEVQLVINAINATEAGLINAYCTQILADYNRQIRADWFDLYKGGLVNLDFTVAYWYNPLLDYKIYMFSGILVIVVTLVSMFLTALNLVREKELGTAEQMNVTPMKRYQFILAKLVPFLLIALFELAFGLVIGTVLFDLPIRGSLLVLFAMAVVFLIVTLGIGLFLSTVSNTQQQMMLAAFFFMITFIMMSGVFTPTDSMPVWAQKINIINPLAYFMKATRMILLKGSGFQDVAREFYSLLVYGSMILSVAILNYRKTT